ncbi:MAG: hypothetical protein N3A57_08360, partial [Negativicutes bacterium]|nr:hypothetical protein [Negativicutes bacterium]
STLATRAGVALAALAFIMAVLAGVLADNSWPTVLLRAGALAALCGALGRLAVFWLLGWGRPAPPGGDEQLSKPDSELGEIAEINKQAGEAGGSLGQ